MFDASIPEPKARVWQVGALCRAIADALQARFNPVQVQGELTGFSRAASGHCYFALKDANGQLRCAMFKRAATGLDFSPRDGELVEVSGRLGVYEPRGDLQLIVERMSRAGLGNLFEQFLQLKAKLEALGWFDAARKRPLPAMPRAIGLVTSLGAAALHDVVTTLQRRVPHIPVILAPASVQGASAPAELISALSKLYLLTQSQKGLEPDLASKNKTPVVDVILLVRGGGAIEDLWAFNDEALAQALRQSPVPVVCGVGHETDFTIADFVADVRAPTPTAAAELVAQPQEAWLNALAHQQQRLMDALQRVLDRHDQRLDHAAQRLGRPSNRLALQQLRLAQTAHHMQSGLRQTMAVRHQHLDHVAARLLPALQRGVQSQQQRLAQAAMRLGLLDPHLVLERGYAWLQDAQGQAIGSVQQTHAGQVLRATLVDGTVDLTVSDPAS
ncbi:exodeoxyribonuclease VII large subunit [Rhodoferax sp.]|uniref:exodeoxyribonuclease VII large subunit n=1 Tax=Rhodoferax sp. TaxID=50421 RepID=UPI00262E89D0|nr:exodeoxyribonuclease VII large subunit [Rhodoferax sp.]MDD4942714.1 exodeoxyribonuclease VII large subunit [Rhodoferax sp.]MDD5479967.1 exodeoxyribonuclease VII large subunit [Rhodoferax sp.]